MKRISIQLRIGFLLTVAVILLTATCYLSYRNISSIVSSVRIELKPDLRLITINDISGDLETAGNSIRMYTISRDTFDLAVYYSIISGIDDKINKLKAECSDDTLILSQVDTISALIEENIVNWNELLFLINKDYVVDFFNNLSYRLNNVPADNGKKGILRRVFTRNNRNILNEKDLKDSIQIIEEQGRINREKLKSGEEQLAVTGKMINARFFALLTRMESQVSKIVKEKGESANKLAESTYLWLLLFSVSGGLLALLVLYIIISYIRNARAYQLALERSKSEAESLAKTKELFMANISHEIRTPVTAISGFAEQLLHEAADENIQRSLKIIKSSSDHLAKIIDDILDLSKLQNGKLFLENIHFSISGLLNEVNLFFEHQAKQKDLDLNYMIKPGTPPVLLGDPYRLKQILINLVGNSIKFTDKGSVSFFAEGIAGIEGTVELLVGVTDSGIGIEADKLDIIFEDFTQAEMSTSRKYGGTGLGLSIVKKLVDLHGGMIECESRRDEGTTIICHLPFRVGLEDQVKSEESLPLSIPEEIKNLKILVVDDEEYNRLLFRKILSRWQVSSDEASSGTEAIARLRERRYDLLFMDIRMPGTDGIMTTRIIRDELKISEKVMPVICISAALNSDEPDIYIQSGMNAFLQKPFTERMLLSAIFSVKGTSQLQVTEEKSEPETGQPAGNRRISLDGLKHISGGDDQFVKQMLVSFMLTTQNGLKEMQDAVESDDWGTLSALAHKLIPPCRHIGALELSAHIGKIGEAVSKKTDKQSVESLISMSVAEFEAVIELLNEYISKIK